MGLGSVPGIPCLPVYLPLPPLQAQAEFGRKAFQKKTVGVPQPNADAAKPKPQAQPPPVPTHRIILPPASAGGSVAARLGTSAAPESGRPAIPGAELEQPQHVKRRGGRGKQLAQQLQLPHDETGGGQSTSQAQQGLLRSQQAGMSQAVGDGIAEPNWITDPSRYEEMLRRMYGDGCSPEDAELDQQPDDSLDAAQREEACLQVKIPFDPQT